MEIEIRGTVQDSGGFPRFSSSWKLVAQVTKRPGNHDTDVYVEIAPVFTATANNAFFCRNNNFITLVSFHSGINSELMNIKIKSD